MADCNSENYINLENEISIHSDYHGGSIPLVFILNAMP